MNPLAVLTLRGSLVVGNRAGQGGGLFVGPFGTVDAAATTVANNTPNDCADDSGTTTC